MTSPEAVQPSEPPIKTEKELYEEKFKERLQNEWLDGLVAAGKASSREAAREEMLRLRDSLVSPESEINQLMEQKIEEILATGSPLTDNKERSYQIVKKLAEIYQQRPELCQAQKGFRLDDPEWHEKLMHLAEREITHSFPMKVLRALEQSYEVDPMRKEWATEILDTCLAASSKTVDLCFLQGSSEQIPKNVRFDEKKLLRLSREQHDALPVVREFLNALTSENAEETYQKIQSLIKNLADTIDERYPYIQPTESFVYRYEKEDDPGREAVHVGAHGTAELALLRGDEYLEYLLLGDLDEVKEKLSHYVTLTDTTPKSKRREVPKDRPLEEKDINRIFGYRESLIAKLVGKTSDEAAVMLFKELKEMARAPEAEK